MWLEEEFPYYKINFDYNSYDQTEYKGKFRNFR